MKDYSTRVSDFFKNKDKFKETFSDFMHISYGKDMAESDMIEKYIVLCKILKTYMSAKPALTTS